MAKLKIAGTWAGLLEVELEVWTVPMLRQEIAKRSSCGPESINLIYAGKILKDGDGSEKLSQMGIKNNAKILSSRVSVEEGKSLKVELLAEEERCCRLARVKAAATSLAKRHANGSLPIEDFNIELEDQSGQKVQLGSETDQRAVMMGLMLHANGKHLIKRRNYKDALEVLSMGEEAFSLCNPKVIEFIDNVPILQIDMVWCYFMLRDIIWLSVAGKRLQHARQGIERAHGKDSSRLRHLQAGRYPEIALHLRLELLEGVVAYHSGQFGKAGEKLTAAQAKFFQLQVPDEALSLVISMGFKDHEAKRALWMNNQDVSSAIDFLQEEKAKKAQKREDDIRRRNEIMEQKRYGITPSKKAVDIQRVNELVSIGFAKELAAEALRRNENDIQKALDDLTNPESNSSIQVYIESRKRKRLEAKKESKVENFVSMGFDRSKVIAAVEAGGTSEQILQRLTFESASNTFEQPGPTSMDTANNVASSSVPSTDNIDGDDSGGPSIPSPTEERDVEMEDELSGEIADADALSDYDIEVTKEGEAITEYLALLDSARNSKEESSSN